VGLYQRRQPLSTDQSVTVGRGEPARAAASHPRRRSRRRERAEARRKRGKRLHWKQVSERISLVEILAPVYVTRGCPSSPRPTQTARRCRQ